MFSLISTLIATLLVIGIFIKDHYVEKKNKKTYFIAMFLSFLAIAGICLGYITEHASKKENTNNFSEIKQQNKDYKEQINKIESKNNELKDVLTSSLKTINNLSDIIEKKDKQRRIEILQNMISEIRLNIISLKHSLIDKKNIFLDLQQHQITGFRFNIDVVKSVVSESLIKDKYLQVRIIDLKDYFEMSNRMLENVNNQDDAEMRTKNWKVFYGNFDENKMLQILDLCDSIEKYINKL